MDLHLDTLLNLPDVTVFTCYQQDGFYVLELELINSKVKCAYCHGETDEIHQNRPILVRDLSISGNKIYLKVPRRQIYCTHCQKYSTEVLAFLDQGHKYTKRYERYIYEQVKELSLEQVADHENLSIEQVQNIVVRVASNKENYL